MFTRDENGKLMARKEEILQRWKQYFEGLMNEGEMAQEGEKLTADNKNLEEAEIPYFIFIR